jgi:hypothetical protein
MSISKTLTSAQRPEHKYLCSSAMYPNSASTRRTTPFYPPFTTNTTSQNALLQSHLRLRLGDFPDYQCLATAGGWKTKRNNGLCWRESKAYPRAVTFTKTDEPSRVLRVMTHY